MTVHENGQNEAALLWPKVQTANKEKRDRQTDRERERERERERNETCCK